MSRPAAFVAAFALLLAWALPAAAADKAPSVSLDDILRQTRAMRAADAKENADREARFKRKLDEQLGKLQNMLGQRNAEEERSNRLSNEFDANESRIKEMKDLLKQHEGNLGELFGVTRQVAGDAVNVLKESMISSQLKPEAGQEGRMEFLQRMAGAKDLPSIRELEKMWYELQREMTETGKVREFKATVYTDKDHSDAMKVVRVGPFTAIANGEYLTYLKDEKAFMVLPRQPPGRFVDVAEDLQKSVGKTGYVPATVDPARGALLALYVERPDIWERIKKGHIVGYVIISVGLLGAVVWLFQLIYLAMMRVAVSWQLRNLDRPARNNPLGRVLLAVRDTGSKHEESAEITELRISEAVLKEVPKIERFQAFLRLVVSAGPLLGLIGTVIGMIITFQAITASGNSDPKLMAHGIGQAMIATVLGLGIAIPLLFAVSGLSALSRGIVQILDEQSTNLLAEASRRRS